MQRKPFAEKLGYVPRPEVLKFISADQKQAVAASLVMNVLLYYGDLVEKEANKVVIPPDYYGMYRTIQTAVTVDPYNMDAYYFAQAILVWDLKRIKEANQLLEHGMKYRKWDFYLPFFAGFNYAYFLKDYTTAARYYKRAGELTGNELHINLAGRYMYESGKTDLAIAYLSTMEKRARNDAVKKSFARRLKAFKEVRRIEIARDRFQEKNSVMPEDVQSLVKDGYLSPPPVDPYGGSFYIDDRGQVRSTSKFASGSDKKVQNQ